MKIVAITVAMAGSASMALAQDTLQIDINALSAQASGAFDESFSGDLFVFGSLANPDGDGDATILDVVIDGTSQGTGGAAPGEFSFEMNISFNDGEIVSGALSLAHDGVGSENTYSTDLVPTDGGAIIDIGAFFIISGLTTNGNWTDGSGTFLGVDISPWGNNVEGFFTQIEFKPDGNGFDPDTDVDVFMFVPAPSSAIALVLGLGLAGRRRR